jgi:putative ABC transport system permease protein
VAPRHPAHDPDRCEQPRGGFMTNGIPDIGPWELALGLVFILLAGLASLAFRLRLGRDLALGTVRTFLQLFIMGYVLTLVFGLGSPWPTLAIFLIMVVSAARIVRGRVGKAAANYGLPVLLSMLASYSLVSVLVVGVIVGAKPWWEPRYFLPIAGMVIGNSMTALAVSLERLFSELRSGRDAVEMRLTLGADMDEASRDAVAASVRAGMMPSIASLMGVGLVFIPGMMTGQILAGADPLIAIRYQIVVMLMLVGSTALCSVAAVLWVRRRCFGTGNRLIV